MFNTIKTNEDLIKELYLKVLLFLNYLMSHELLAVL